MKIKLVPYKDLWIRIGLSVVLVVFFEFLGAESMDAVVGSRLFVTDLIAGVILAFAVMSFIRALSIYLDRKYPWNKRLAPRIVIQFFAGVVLPSLFVLGYVYVYFFSIMKATEEEVVFFDAEFPLAVLLIIFWNLVYVGYFFSLESKKQKNSSNQTPS